MKNLLYKRSFEERNNLRKTKWKNDGFRSIFESVVHPDVSLALKDWKENTDYDGVLVGGLALQYYIRPRATDDIDLLFMSQDDMPLNVYKFRKHRKSAFEHIKTGVEVELLTPGSINTNKQLFIKAFEDAIEIDGIKVASPKSIISLKLGRFKGYDKADIEQLYRYCLENNISVDFSDYKLDEEQLKNLDIVINGLNENKWDNMYIMELNSLLKMNKNEKIVSDLPHDIYVFEDLYGEPRFHFGNNTKSSIRKYTDFQFSISLTDTFCGDKLKVLESSTDYKSFNSFRNEEVMLKEWLLKDDNLSILRNSWNRLNIRKRKI